MMLFPSSFTETLFDYHLRRAIGNGVEFQFEWIELHLDTVVADGVFVGRRKDGNIHLLECVLPSCLPAPSAIREQIPDERFSVVYGEHVFNASVVKLEVTPCEKYSILIDYMKLLEFFKSAISVSDMEFYEKLLGIACVEGARVPMFQAQVEQDSQTAIWKSVAAPATSARSKTWLSKIVRGQKG